MTLIAAPEVLIGAIGAAAGAIIGSFLALAAIRLPDGGAIIGGRSRCDHCKKTLSPWELLPIASFILQRGRCRTCAGRISRLHPAMEIAAALVGLLVAVLAQTPLDLVWVFFGWGLLLLAVLDWRHMWLPDKLTYTLAILGLAFGSAAIFPPADRIIGLVAGFMLLESVRRGYKNITGRDGMGTGDPKLFAAIGAWTGWQALPFILVGASLIGLFHILFSWRRQNKVERHTALPLGSYLAVSAVLVWVMFTLFPRAALGNM